MSKDLPLCRWGIVATGFISSWFVEDLVLIRHDAKARHVIQCIGSSSIQKAKEFVAKYIPDTSPHLYASYEEVYADENVDCVYIGKPHSFHKKNCLDAIGAGKNILCEKAFAINAREAKEVIEAARRKGTYIHEGMWLRHRPLVLELRRLLYEEKVIGEVFRMQADFALDIDLSKLPASSRYKDINLGAGTLLDLGIYSLTWALLTLDPGSPSNSERPKICATQDFQDGIEVATNVLLQFPSTGRQGVISSTTMGTFSPDNFCRIDGSDGYIEIEGLATSTPLSFTVYPKLQGDPNDGPVKKPQGRKYDFPKVGRGFIHEADDTALDIAAGRKESQIMPWSETIRVMEIMDEIRRQGGTVYPQDNI